MKKVVSLILVLSMMFVLCACGSTQTQSGTANNTQTKTEPDVTPEPEYVYAASSTSLLQGTKFYYTPVFYTDSGVYCRTYEKVGERELRDGETHSYEGQLDVYDAFMYFISFDGNVTKLTDYTEILDVEPNAPEEYRADENIDTYPMVIVGTAGGKLISIDEVYESWNEAPKGVVYDSDEWYGYTKYSERYYIRVLNPDGSEASCMQLIIPEEHYFYTYGCAPLDEEHVVVATDNGMIKIGTDGSMEVVCSGLEGSPENCIDLNDDQIGVCTYSDGYQMAIIDKSTLEIKETHKLPNNAYNFYKASGKYDLYYRNGIDVYGYSLTEEKTEKLFNLISCDVDPESIDTISIDANGRIVAITNNWNKDYTINDVNLLTIGLVPASSVPQKETLIFATEYLSYDTQRAIIEFNRKHSDVRIEVKTYSEYNTDEDWSAGITKLITEIMAGQVPDIVDLNSLPKSQIAAKGLLEDLYPYIDKDSEMSREDFFPNVLKASEIDGKLYNTVSSFKLITCAGAKSIVGDRIGWTYDDVREALSKLPEGAEIFDQYTTQSDMLSACLSMELGSLVDWNTGTCHFDTQAFADMLKFVSQFKSSFDWDNYEWSEDEGTDKRIMSGKQMLMQAYLFDFSDLMYYGHYFGGEENVSFIGFPTSDGSNGSAISFNGSEMAMSSKCSNKEAAWEFLRIMMAEENQSSSYNGYPSNIKAFMAKLEEAKTPDYVLDSNGNRVLGENGEYVMRAKMTYGDESGTYDIYNMSDEMADTILELVNTITKVYNNDESILSIVQEQSAAFFAGQKSAEEVAKYVQSKANIYINEQR